jgi:regulator of CtrA degradation
MSFGSDNNGGSNQRLEQSEFVGSELFQRTYREGMALVEEAATYLDGPGRDQAKDLPRATALAYATESMRLTTRLMQVAAWLLVQKAVHEGDMSEDEAMAEKYELGGRELARGEGIKGSDQLPDALRDLVIRSERIFSRIDRLDTQMRADDRSAHSSLSDQQQRVEAFFRDTLDPSTTKH